MSKVFVALLIIASFILGFVSGRVGGGLLPNQSAQKPKTVESEAVSNGSALFKSQTATFQGKITEVSGNMAKVKSDTQEGEFEISDKVVIYKFLGSSPTASASSDLKMIETDKMVLATLELMDGKYIIVSISYFRQAQ